MAKKVKKPDYDWTEDKETNIITRFGLIKTSNVYNRPYDAIDLFNNFFELKSSSKENVSTARDCNIRHIKKWRHVNWIVGFWNRAGSHYEDIYLLTPKEMKEWLDMMEEDFNEIDRYCRMIYDEYKDRHDIEETRLRKMLIRARTKNDPRIKNEYIRRNGIPIDTKEDLYGYLHDGIIPKHGLLAFAAMEDDDMNLENDNDNDQQWKS